MTRARDLADIADLDISGTLTVDDIVLSDADAPSITLTDTTNTLTTFLQSGNSTAVLGTSTAHDLRIQANSNDAIRVASGGDISFYDDGGNAKLVWDASAESLGIGTSSAGAQVELKSTTPFIRLQDDQSTVSDGTNMGGIEFRTADSSVVGASRITAKIRVEGDGTFNSPAKSPSRMIFSTHATSGTDPVDALTIDSSGSLLVGKTEDGFTSAGHAFFGGGDVYHIKDGNAAIYAKRLSSHGDIIKLFKDSTHVGSIASKDGDTAIGTSGVGIRFGQNNSDQITPHSMSTNGGKDNSITLGSSGARFKDLFLSGGVYLGGTGASNKLDDVETGTWSPQYGGTAGHPTVSYHTQVGLYTKIGDFVHLQGRIRTSSASGGGGSLELKNLPFTTNSSNNSFSIVNIAYANAWTTSNFPSTGYINPNQNTARLIKYNSDDPRQARTSSINVSSLSNGNGYNDILFSIQYMTS